MTESDIAREGAEERNTVSNEHWYAGDNKTLNESNSQKGLYRGPTVDVEVMGAARSKPRNDLSRMSTHLLNNTGDPG